MIFGPDMVWKVKAGSKTQTRRKIRGDCRYKPGRAYAIQTGRGKPATAHITITSVEEQELGAITLREAKAEGFRTRAEFEDYWKGLYGSHDPKERVHVISFLLGDHTDSDRFPAARPGPGGDYVQSGARALTGTAPEVSEATQKLYAARSAETYAEALQQRKKRLQSVLREIRSQADDPLVNARLRAVERRVKRVRPMSDYNGRRAS